MSICVQSKSGRITEYRNAETWTIKDSLVYIWRGPSILATHSDWERVFRK